MKKYFLLSFAFALVSSSSVYASVAGNISPSHYATYVCYDSACAEHSSINFLPSGGANPVTITNSVVTGYAWGDNLGWINFAPSGSGVVYDSSTGNLSGYAWSSTSGWINFRPSNSGTVSSGIPVGVKIQSDGSWYGWAFASGKAGGWIKFDCADNATCVKVVFSSQTVSTSGGGSYFATPLSVSAAPAQNKVPPVEIKNNVVVEPPQVTSSSDLKKVKISTAKVTDLTHVFSASGITSQKKKESLIQKGVAVTSTSTNISSTTPGISTSTASILSKATSQVKEKELVKNLLKEPANIPTQNVEKPTILAKIVTFLVGLFLGFIGKY